MLNSRQFKEAVVSLEGEQLFALKQVISHGSKET